jgi:cyclic beta-1,2-glucan synthetase
VRQELFGIERLEQHARTLASAQPVTGRAPRVLSLQRRLDQNAKVLLAAYRASAAELERGRSVVPAAEWLLDNYHLVEQQVREIREDLPPGYYRQLPKLASGPFAGYPRVFGIAWAFVAHTDSHLDPASLQRFIAAYQTVQPLTIGELWAVAITLRIVLVENLRRLCDQITVGRRARADAQVLANRLLVAGRAHSALETDVNTRAAGPLSETFAAQLAKRLRDQDPLTTPALGWLEERLRLQGTSVDEVVERAHQRQGASNVTVRNVITSMRLVSDIDWAELFEKLSLVDERLRAGGDFADMDFQTRNLYRGAVEQLARGSPHSELEITMQALRACEAARAQPTHDPRAADVGYHLIAEGRPALEIALAFKAPRRLAFTRWSIRLGVGGYVAAILFVTALLLELFIRAAGGADVDARLLVLLGLAAFVPATDVAVALVNRLVAWSFGAVALPGLALRGGVPAGLRTLVAIPTLLTSEADLLEQIERLAVHHLSGAGGEIAFALLTDGLDADQESREGDMHLIEVATEAIAALNRQHGPAPDGGARFFLLHRRRLYNEGERKWMGWERKRGKLHELNRLLRGATDTSFLPGPPGQAQVPAGVRFVICLDADTRLPRDAAARLIGKMAHPLNRPRWSEAAQRVTSGYAILQPRVTPSLPVGREGSFYQRLFSAPGGIDPYAAAASDVYQDLFGEGSYTGKGIYDIDAFEAALAGRVPPGTMLSHDLFEGTFARAGLASDIEVIEEFPSRYDVAAKRQHRWTRGDWQLLPWLLQARSHAQSVPPVGLAKMLDNLRRSLLAPLLLATLAMTWLLPLASAAWAVLLVIAAMALPVFLPSFFAIVPQRAGISVARHLRMLAADLRLAALHTLFTLALLPDQAWRMADAIVRTLWRLAVTRTHLLEWTTAAQSARAPRLDALGFYRQMAGGIVAGLALAALALALEPPIWPLVTPFVLLWLAAPALALWAGRTPAAAQAHALAPGEAAALRLVARRTWRFFETFVTPAENMLPPDNFQEDPRPVVAHRTSPTNIGLYFLSAVSARDFGWAGTLETLDRIEAAFASLDRMQRFKGHFYNWYGTLDLQPLAPAYVSSVDSGNLAGHLIALANACDEWMAAPSSANLATGAADDLRLAHEAMDVLPAASGEAGRPLAKLLAEMRSQMKARPEGPFPAVLKRLVDKAAQATLDLLPRAEDARTHDLVFWIEAFGRVVAQHDRDRAEQDSAPQLLRQRLKSLAARARAMAMEMDFAFLLDPERKLLSIGYSLADNRLDPSCYDLLASEARLASLFAIAKGDAPTRHWFRLGRTATPMGHASALISWSGSMFEYLMPSLVMRAPAGSVLEQTTRLVVRRQRAYAESLDIPWGISESAYNARDMEFTYQYSNFGVPGLGLKRGLADNLVIAPYATGLASMVDAAAALANFARLAAMGAAGRYGFYEALDFTRVRLPDDADFAVVRCFMAHHQGMTIVAIDNALNDGRMRERFHREPMIKACELLMQERMPRDVAVGQPRAEEVKASPTRNPGAASGVRRLAGPVAGPPVTHLLSNGRYAVMLSAAGAGYSRWRDIAVTRWREDATRDDWGSFVFLRDGDSGALWCPTAQPLGESPEHAEVMFDEDHAQFSRPGGTLAVTMTVLVASEDDGEVRHVSLVNSGRRPREIELTSYMEIVLAPPAADDAHPAFSKLFVQTEWLPEFGALLATRRPRSAEETPVWAAHFAVVEGEALAGIQFESDRARFLGRGNSVANADAMTGAGPLSNTSGTVLDAIFSVRQRVRIAPGKSARLAFWTLVAPSRAELLHLVDKYHDRNAFERAKTLAWTQAQVQLRHIGVKAEEAADFQRLAAPILYADAGFRSSAETIARGAGPQSGLWPHSISGDLPIVLLRIGEVEDLPQLRELLRAHEYWRMKRLAVDLVIVNERAASYVQDLQVAVETAIRSSQSQPRFGAELAKGSVYALRADLMSVPARALLQSVARVALIARRGSIAEQLALVEAARPQAAAAIEAGNAVAQGKKQPGPPGLEFFNGLGGFADDGREYVVVLDAGATTPAPWLNVVANARFGFQASADGSGYTWSENSRENQLTTWSNDSVRDPAGEAFYIQDDMSGALWTATAQPMRDGGTYIARHGFGYSRFAHEADGIAADLLQYVPLNEPVKVSRLTLRNVSGVPRRLVVTAYAEWVLGTSRAGSAPFIGTEIDAATGALLACNAWSTAFPGRVAFADLGGTQTSFTADRAEFLGPLGGPHAPAALVRRRPLSGRAGAGADPCAALQRVLELGVGESAEVVFFLGQCESAPAASDLIARMRHADLDAVLAQVTHDWRQTLGAVQVKTPDRAMDIMLNGWLLYQTLACRIWARSAFYQASGAYGFRDQLQDGMALSLARPREAREHLLRAAGRQFAPGDVQHWWLPHSGQGVRTHISDDRVWLAYAAASYVATSGDAGVLDEVLPFLDGPPLGAREHDAFFQPMPADGPASLFEHCARGLDQCVALTGPLGLPLIGTGDWNDGFNRVGEGGQGESVWLGWLLLRTIALFAPLADTRDAVRAARWRAHANRVQEALECEAWDGEWYRRATYDDGTWLGSAGSDECRIDSIAQSWAVLCEAADPDRAAVAMASLDRQLIDRAEGLALLFTPPFDRTPRDPGYIKGYPPGLRENGGQYSHAAMWAVLAFAKLREGAKAAELFSLLNPVNHGTTPQQVRRYKVEPYVVAADVYSVAPHAGRGGWTWYTGAAGWMYRAGVEGILGIRREGAFLAIEPRIPPSWPGFGATVSIDGTGYAIEVVSRSGRCGGVLEASLDGNSLNIRDGAARVALDGKAHTLRLVL